MSRGHCECEYPQCSKCGLSVRRNIQTNSQSHPESDPDIIPDQNVLLEVLNRCLQDIEKPEIHRNVHHVCKIHSSLISTKNALSQGYNQEVLKIFCEEVGLNNVEPIICLLQFLSVERNSVSELSRCITKLSKHRDKLLSPCVECTSPSTHPQNLCYIRPHLLLDIDQDFVPDGASVECTSPSVISTFADFYSVRPTFLPFRNQYYAEGVTTMSPVETPM